MSPRSCAKTVWMVVCGLALLAAGPVCGGTSTWTGNGNSNNSGGWGDVNNWDAGGIPATTNDIAVLPKVTNIGNSGTTTRTITNEASRSVREVNQTYNNGTYSSKLSLNADLNVGQFTGISYGQENMFPVAIGTSTLTIGTNNLTTTILPLLQSGSGIVRKVGTGSATFGQSFAHNFAGTYEVRGGTLIVSWGNLSASATMEVYDGGTHSTGGGGDGHSLPMRLRGGGYNGQGALKIKGNVTKNTALELVEDAAIAVDSGMTFNLNALSGAGKLTKIGTGIFKITGDSDGYTNAVTISNGTLSVIGLLRNSAITVKTNATLDAAAFRVGAGKVTVEPGGTWNVDTRPQWIAGSNFDGNNDGNWSAGTNWSLGSAPGATNTAVLPKVTGNGNSGTPTRTLTIDTPATVREVNQTYNNSTYYSKLSLNADLSVGQFTGINYGEEDRFPVAIGTNTLTIGSNDLTTTYLPLLQSGSGIVRKVGTGSATFGQSYVHNFVGTYEVRGGTLSVSWGSLSASATVDVYNGGTYLTGNAGNGHSLPMRIRGSGYNGQGALKIFGTITKNSALELVEDAVVAVDSGVTFSLNALSGAGKLTKIGTGTLKITGDSDGYTADTTISNGTLSVIGLLRNSAITVKSNATLDAAAFRVGPGKVTVEAGGTWNADLRPQWIAGSNFDGNNDGNWSAGTNWSLGSAPGATDTAILPKVTGNGADGTPTRTITIDTPATVREVNLAYNNATYYSKLSLNADFNVGQFTGLNYGEEDRFPVAIGTNTLTIGSNDLQTAFLPLLQSGSGIVRKVGTNTASFAQTFAHNFAGTYEVRGGTLSVGNGSLSPSATVEVYDGGTYLTGNGGNGHSPVIRLRGSGYNGQGALKIFGNVTKNTALEIVEDAALAVDSGVTFAISPLSGAGRLTKIGLGTLDMNGTWTVSIAGGLANATVAKTGAVDIAGCTLAITNLPAAAVDEVVVLDYNWPSGAVIGQFAATNGLRANWTLVRNGTSRNPNAIVLVPPPGGTVFKMR